MKVLGKGVIAIAGVGLLIGLVVLVTQLQHKKEDNQGVHDPVTGEIDTMAFEVYFSRGDSGDCSLVEPVTRTVPQTNDIARAAVLALLGGPTPQELQDGYLTSINDGTELRELEMTGSTLEATFSSRLQEGIAGSCRVTAIRSQIEQTLKQFATVSQAVIHVEGVPDAEILQP